MHGQRTHRSDSTQKAVRRIVVDVTFEVVLPAKQVGMKVEINPKLRTSWLAIEAQFLRTEVAVVQD
jgi:hypothetical protein